MPTVTSRPATTDVVALAASLERVVSLLRRLATTPDISLTAASTLRTHERDGPVRLSQLAGYQGVTQPAMTQLVGRLERDGLVSRGDDPDDARVVLVHLTSRGRDLTARRRRVRAERLGVPLESLSGKERAAIFAALPALERLADLGLAEAT